MALSQERQGQIALKMLDYAMRRKLQDKFEGMKRELGNLAKETGVPYEELKSFLKPIAQSVLDEMFKSELPR